MLLVANQKGGVGKTTLAVHLALAFHELNKRVVAVDCDAQYALTRHFNASPSPLSLVDVITDELDPCDATVQTASGVDVLCATRELMALETGLVSTIGREFVFRERLQPLSERYDVVILDAPPNLGLLTVNALIAASHVIVPVSTEDEGAVHGLSELIHTLTLLERLRGDFPQLTAVLNRYDQRKVMNTAAIEALRQLDVKIAKQRVPSRVAFQHAKASRVPLHFKKNSPAYSVLQFAKSLKLS